MAWLEAAILGSVLVGVIASIVGYLEYRKALSGGSLVCRADGKPGGCKSVYLIPQAMVAGRVHLSEVAPLYFTALLVAAVMHVVLSNPWPLLLLSLAGAVLVPYLVYLEVKVARAICIWCTIMHASIILTLALTLGSLFTMQA
ncbi:MAG: hypothetical protein F7B17_02240 [Desulfurococcales archaeon]|nr:hypothetical protein [Desulfurococcales archaeon]